MGHLLLLAALALHVLSPKPLELRSGTELSALFAEQVDKRIDLPEQDREGYAERLSGALAAAGLADLPSQYFVLVDIAPKAQAVMIYWKSHDGKFYFIGASPASSGRTGEFEHFRTPTGVFDHSIDNPDFRAEGTKNEYGVRGYGVKGMRVFDFGWQEAVRGWGGGGESLMRLQMHATDPDMLEARIGTPQSKGCIRIPATLNVFIDRYGLLDADYERALAQGRHLWMLRPDRRPTPWPGRYLVIVDSERAQRLDGAPLRSGAAKTAGSIAEPLRRPRVGAGRRYSRAVCGRARSAEASLHRFASLSVFGPEPLATRLKIGQRVPSSPQLACTRRSWRRSALPLRC